MFLGTHCRPASAVVTVRNVRYSVPSTHDDPDQWWHSLTAATDLHVAVATVDAVSVDLTQSRD